MTDDLRPYIDMLDPADPPSPLTAHVGYHVNGWRNDCPACVMQDAGSLGHNLAVPRLGHSGDFADCPQALCVRVRAALASSPAPAGLDVARETLALVMKQLRDEGYHDWPDLLERDVLPAIRAATRPAEDADR